MWAIQDQPLPERIVTSTVFGVKYLLKQWGYEAEAVWADPEGGKVWVGRELAVHVAIDNGSLKVEYGTDWEA
eukprot:4143622-Pyramimonas_sp.AAC.1